MRRERMLRRERLLRIEGIVGDEAQAVIELIYKAPEQKRVGHFEAAQELLKMGMAVDWLHEGILATERAVATTADPMRAGPGVWQAAAEFIGRCSPLMDSSLMLAPALIPSVQALFDAAREDNE